MLVLRVVALQVDRLISDTFILQRKVTEGMSRGMMRRVVAPVMRRSSSTFTEGWAASTLMQQREPLL